MVTTRTRTYMAPIKPKKFPFLRLPLELRDRIYYYAIHSHYDTSAILLVLEGCLPVITNQHEKPLSALTVVNRQLRLEAQNAMHHHMSLCVVFARFKNSTPSTSQKHTISKSFKELQKWRHIVLSPSDADVNCCLSLLWPDPDFFLLILKRMDVHEELEKFVKAIPAQFLKRVELHIDDHELASMAYCIEKPETLANEEYERVTIRIRDWCLQNRTLIKAMPQWIQYWEDKGRKYEWVDYDLVKNRATGKKRYITIPRRNATCDDGDQCSEWQ